MAKRTDELDFFTLCMIVLGVITVVWMGLAYVLRQQVKQRHDRIVGEIARLEKMQELATDPELRKWISYARRGKNQPQRSPTEFKAHINAAANKNNLRLSGLDALRESNQRTFIERPFEVKADDTDLQPFIRTLFDVEEGWPGSKVKELVLTWSEKKGSWDCQATVSIFAFET